MVPSLPAKLWQLSETGRLRCKVLADKIMPYSPQVIVTSTEPKATETAQIISDLLGKTFTMVEGLQEHDRSNVAWLDTERFEAKVAEFFRHPQALVSGNETAKQAYGRFASAIAVIINEHPASNIAIIAHGTVISLFVAQVVGVEPFHFWKQLGLPSFAVLPLPQMHKVIALENRI